jgi:hypothetical protein
MIKAPSLVVAVPTRRFQWRVGRIAGGAFFVLSTQEGELAKMALRERG